MYIWLVGMFLWEVLFVLGIYRCCGRSGEDLWGVEVRLLLSYDCEVRRGCICTC